MNRRMIPFLKSCAAILIITMLHACVREEICQEPSHPHMSSVSFIYDLSNLYESSSKPADMRIACNKIIYSNVTNLQFDLNKNSGKFIDNRPASISAAANKDLTVFPVQSGEYKFFTMNMGLKAFDFTELNDYLNSNRTANLATKWLSYKVYDQDAEEVKELNDDWSDYNKYHHTDGTDAEFIMPIKDPLIVDSTDIIKVAEGTHVTAHFKPMMLTHNIDVYFDIKKDVSVKKFVVDSVFCVISGVPATVNIGTGALDISNTNKVMYKGMLTTPSEVPSNTSVPIVDTQENKKLRVYRNMNILGIIENEYTQADQYAGPGIMQCIIYLTVFDEPIKWPEGRPKRINGMVNLHNSLTKAKLQTYDAGKNLTKKSRPHSDLFIGIDLTIDESFLRTDDDGGIEHWIDNEHLQGDDFDIY